MRVAVVGAGVGGLACAVRCAEAGHRVVVLEAGPAPGGKAGLLELDGWRFDTGPSLLTMPWVLRDLLGERIELVRVEPVTSYRFADGSELELSADLPRALESLEGWAPGAGADWTRLLGACAAMWRASLGFMSGPPPWPPRRPRAGEPRPDPRDLARVRPWHTLRTLARGLVRDPRLRLVVERFATYAGGDPRRAPAVLALAGYVEHAFGAWHVRGGIHEIVRALVGRLEELGGELRLGTPVSALLRRGGRAVGVAVPAGELRADAVVWNGDELALASLLRQSGRDGLRDGACAPGLSGEASRARGARRGAASGGAAASRVERSLSGFALMLALRGRAARAHHRVAFPADYDSEFDAIFRDRRPVPAPTLYVATSSVTDPDAAPPDAENAFVLVNAPTHRCGGPDWDVEADAYERHLLERLEAAGFAVRGRIAARARRTPADLERETGAVGGAIYGAAPHGRLAALRRPGPRVRGLRGLWRVGGTVHPGGGLPLVTLGGLAAAREIGPA